MPIYEYQCTTCKHQLEAFQSISEAPLIDCPACQKPSLTKLISAAGFQLKGSGWYLTDYSSKNKSSAESTTSSTATTDASVTKTTDANSSTSGGTTT